MTGLLRIPYQRLSDENVDIDILFITLAKLYFVRDTGSKYVNIEAEWLIYASVN